MNFKEERSKEEDVYFESFGGVRKFMSNGIVKDR